MIRRLPILPTLIVLLAVGVMIWLGLWQLGRRQEKEALLARYASARTLSSQVPFPTTPDDRVAHLYRYSALKCDAVLGLSSVAGRSDSGAPGNAQSARCRLDDGSEATVVLGWSRGPETVRWSGGSVSGVIGPGAGEEVRLIAVPPLAGLQANALPDPGDLPNNHLSYAVQWFLFALTALVIYAIALRKRLAPAAPPR